MKEGWVTAQRELTKVTQDTGVGNLSKATEKKVKSFVEDSVAEIARFFLELHNTQIDDLYED